MKLQLAVVFVAFLGLIWMQPGFCDGLSNEPGLSNWTCTCSLPYQGNQSYVKSNCSTSCDCSPVGGTTGTWTCECMADGFPKVTSDIHDSTCFTSCNCTSGPFVVSQASRSHNSRKVVVIIILLSVVLTTLAFLGSFTFYVYQKVKCSLFSSDRETGCNSTTNLISDKASSVSATTTSIDFPVNNFSGCFGRGWFLFWTKPDIIHGSIIRFTYSDLESATEKFSESNLIGLGGSSQVYRGQLKNGQTVAVKRLTAQDEPDADSLFRTEVEVLSRLHHCHVVPLLGYCLEFQGKHSERLLIFEYMPNGNLRDCLNGTMGETTKWETRITIAIGAARGLEYLHEAAAPRILHRDVKSTNVLLDDKWRAKITDLGMAKRLRADDAPSCSSSPARMQGTFGYFAPEYAMVGRASLMSDVFSFGVVLLELITGRHPIQKVSGKGEEESLVLWATPRLQDSRRVITDLPDPRLNGNFPHEEMQIMAYLAKECLLLDPDARPTMREVVQILSTISPDKSKRSIPVNIFQMSSPHSRIAEPFIVKTKAQPDDPLDAAKIRRATTIRSSALSPASNVEKSLSINTGNDNVDNVSTEYMERLILSTSKSPSGFARDDDTVDLTEPRLESFNMANIKSP